MEQDPNFALRGPERTYTAMLSYNSVYDSSMMCVNSY